VTGDCLCLNLGIECWCPRPGPGGVGYAAHGTRAGARRHYRRDGPGWVCEPCRQAERRDAATRARPRVRRRSRPAPPPYPRDPGRQVREMREYAGLTQEGLADRLGVIRVTVERWETGRRRPRPGMLARVAEVTGAPADGTAAWDVAA